MFRCTLEEAAFDSVNSGKQGDRRERNRARNLDGSWKQQQKHSVLEIQKHGAGSSGSGSSPYLCAFYGSHLVLLSDNLLGLGARTDRCQSSCEPSV